jgi:hypothetical protein
LNFQFSTFNFQFPLSGGNGLVGFATGALGSLGGSAFMSYVGDGVLGTVGFFAAFGGLSAVATGGDFWRGAAVGATVGLLNHAAHVQESYSRSKLLVNSVRAFLEDLGYPADQVAKDVVTHQHSFFGRYYARMYRFSNYETSFTDGHYDSYSGTRNAWVSSPITVKKGWLSQTFALKYYPSRSHSVGLILSGWLAHRWEAGLALVDGWIRDLTGVHNVLYDMHGQNAAMYLFLR